MTFFDHGNNMMENQLPKEIFENREGARSQEKETTENFYKVNSNDNVQRLELN